MLTWAAYLLAAGALVGLALIALANAAPSRDRIWLPGLAHGLLAALGSILLVAGWIRGPVRGVEQGASSFGTAATGLVVSGLFLGIMLFVSRLRTKRPAMLLIALHATLGVAGLVMLAAYISD